MDGNAEDFLITTVDNPYDPFEEFDDWQSYDTSVGYNTWQKIERLMPNNYLRMSLSERNYYVSKAITRLIELLPGIYVKAYRLTGDDKEANIAKYRNAAKELVKDSEKD